MVTFVKKDIVKESMKYNKGLTSKPEPFKCIEASTEVSIFLIYLERNAPPPKKKSLKGNFRTEVVTKLAWAIVVD